MKAKYYDTAYAGSMSLREDGDFINRYDNESLIAALYENILSDKRKIEDLRNYVLSLESALKCFHRKEKLAGENINNINV